MRTYNIMRNATFALVAASAIGLLAAPSARAQVNIDALKMGNGSANKVTIQATGLAAGGSQTLSIPDPGAASNILLSNALAGTGQTVASSGAANTDLSVSNSSGLLNAGTPIGAAVSATGAGLTNIGVEVSATGGTNNTAIQIGGTSAAGQFDMVGTANPGPGPSWSISNTGAAVFSGLTTGAIVGGFISSAGADPYTIPTNVFVVMLTGATHTVNLPAEVDGKELKIYNTTATPTIGGVGIPSGASFTVIGAGGSWILENN